MLVKKAQPLPIEVIVRRYITGSLWRDYEQSKHHVYELSFDSDLMKNQKFDKPIITPSTKEGYGKHDQPISKKEIIKQKLVSKSIYEKAEDYALKLFQRGEKWANQQGLILVDTKYEFGLVDGELIVIDEIHTPDSSRYWIKDEYEMFTEYHPNALLIPVASTGGATKIVYDTLLPENLKNTRFEKVPRAITDLAISNGIHEFTNPMENSQVCIRSGNLFKKVNFLQTLSKNSVVDPDKECPINP